MATITVTATKIGTGSPTNPFRPDLPAATRFAVLRDLGAEFECEVEDTKSVLFYDMATVAGHACEVNAQIVPVPWDATDTDLETLRIALGRANKRLM